MGGPASSGGAKKFGVVGSGVGCASVGPRRVYRLPLISPWPTTRSGERRSGGSGAAPGIEDEVQWMWTSNYT